MKNLTPGFYWVHFKDNYQDEWTIGEYLGKNYSSVGSWNILATDEIYHTTDFFEVGSKIERFE